MLDTLGSMRAEVQDWLAGDTLPDTRINGAINDAIESLWKSLVRVALSVFMGGPTSISFSAGDQRQTVTSLTDPTTAPTLASVAGGTLPSRTVFVGYTLVTESGSETKISSQSTQTTALNFLTSISPPAWVSGAAGWNCYAGDNTNRLAKQNDAPLAFSTTGNVVTFEEPETGFIDNPDYPLPPTENTTGDNIFYIRHLELQLSSGNYKAYHAGDLDSEFVRRFASSIASTSEYQSYAWDVLNQRTLEIRPAAGSSITPRYFYIVKPRRLRFDNAPLPFPTIPCTEFLRSYALSRLLLSLHEFDAAKGFAEVAENERKNCEKALSMVNFNKNTTVTPYMY